MEGMGVELLFEVCDHDEWLVGQNVRRQGQQGR